MHGWFRLLARCAIVWMFSLFGTLCTADPLNQSKLQEGAVIPKDPGKTSTQECESARKPRADSALLLQVSHINVEQVSNVAPDNIVLMQESTPSSQESTPSSQDRVNDTTLFPTRGPCFTENSTGLLSRLKRKAIAVLQVSGTLSVRQTETAAFHLIIGLAIVLACVIVFWLFCHSSGRHSRTQQVSRTGQRMTREESARMHQWAACPAPNRATPTPEKWQPAERKESVPHLNTVVSMSPSLGPSVANTVASIPGVGLNTSSATFNAPRHSLVREESSSHAHAAVPVPALGLHGSGSANLELNTPSYTVTAQGHSSARERTLSPAPTPRPDNGVHGSNISLNPPPHASITSQGGRSWQVKQTPETTLGWPSRVRSIKDENPTSSTPSRTARFFLPIVEISRLMQEGDVHLMGFGGRALLVASVRYVGGRRSLSIKVPGESTARVTISPKAEQDTPEHATLEIRGLLGTLYGMLEMEAGSPSRVLQGGRTVMTIRGDVESYDLTASNETGHQMASAKWTKGPSRDIDHVEVHIEPGVDTVIVMGCMLAIFLFGLQAA